MGAWRTAAAALCWHERKPPPASPPRGAPPRRRWRRLASPPRAPPPRPLVAEVDASTADHRRRRAAARARRQRRPAASAELGIPRASAPDLLWVARRALVAKVPEGASAVPYFIALAGRLLSPAWPEAEAAEETPKSGAWTRATAVAAFAGQNGAGCRRDEERADLIDFGDPGADGWVTAARWPDARETGLVPESYLRKHDFRVVASTAYEAASDGELSFAAGETLVVRTGVLPSRGCWLACVRGRRGCAAAYRDDEWRQQAARNVAAIWILWPTTGVSGLRASRAALRGALRLSDGRAVAVKRSDSRRPPSAKPKAGPAVPVVVASRYPLGASTGATAGAEAAGEGGSGKLQLSPSGRTCRLSAAARGRRRRRSRSRSARSHRPRAPPVSKGLASEHAFEGDGGGGGGGGGGAQTLDGEGRRRFLVRVSAARSHPRRHQTSSRDERRCAAVVRPTSAALIRRVCCPRHLEWSRRRRRAVGARRRRAAGGAQPRQCEAETRRRRAQPADVLARRRRGRRSRCRVAVENEDAVQSVRARRPRRPRHAEDHVGQLQLADGRVATPLLLFNGASSRNAPTPSARRRWDVRRPFREVTATNPRRDGIRRRRRRRRRFG